MAIWNRTDKYQAKLKLYTYTFFILYFLISNHLCFVQSLATSFFFINYDFFRSYLHLTNLIIKL